MTDFAPRKRDDKDWIFMTVVTVVAVLATVLWTWRTASRFESDVRVWFPILREAWAGAVVIVLVAVTAVLAYLGYRRSLSSKNLPTFLIGGLCLFAPIPVFAVNLIVAGGAESKVAPIIAELRAAQEADRASYLAAVEALELDALIQRPQPALVAERTAAARALIEEYQERTDRHVAKARFALDEVNLAPRMKASWFRELETREPGVTPYVAYLHELEKYRLRILEDAAKAPSASLRAAYAENERLIAGHLEWLEENPIFISTYAQREGIR